MMEVTEMAYKQVTKPDFKEPVFTKDAMSALQASWNDGVVGKKPTAKKKTTAKKAAKKPTAKKSK